MLKKLFIIIIFTHLAFLITFNYKALAQTGAEIDCYAPQKTNSNFNKTSTGPNLATTTTYASIAPLWGVPAQVLFGAPLEKVYPCAGNYTYELVQSAGIGGITLGEGCDQVEEDICNDMGIFQNGNTTGKVPGGNLLGMSYIMEKTLKEPIPVSLAYYINQNAKKIPGISQTALAQDTVEYGGPFLNAIYHYWTISRNVAYAFLAAAMTVIGIMIIMGKSIDPKAGITVQQALPQIIIALILITFSYPIGAAGASLAYNVKGSLDSWDLLQSANNIDPSPEQGPMGVGLTIVSLLVPGAGFFTNKAGPLVLLSGIAAAVVSLIMGMLVMFKIFGIYLKMLFAILSAPVSFAIGAMPGNSDTTMNWFKQYGAYMVSIPVMSFAAWFVFYLSMDISLKAMTSYDELGGWWFGRIAGLATAVITAFGYNIVLTIPDKIDGMFGVKTK